MIASAIVSAVGVVSSASNASKARRQQRKARKIDEKRARLEASRGAAEQVRQGQLARASVLQQGENQGASGSTAIQGAVGSIQSQTGSNIGFAQTIFGLQNSANRMRQAAQESQGRSAGFSQLGSLAMSVNASGMVDGMDQSIFGSTSGTGTVMNDSFRGIGS